MESSILSEVDDTSILRTGLPSPLWPSSQLATGLSPLAPRSGLKRSDFVHWHPSDAVIMRREGLITGLEQTHLQWAATAVPRRDSVAVEVTGHCPVEDISLV